MQTTFLLTRLSDYRERYDERYMMHSAAKITVVITKLIKFLKSIITLLRYLKKNRYRKKNIYIFRDCILPNFMQNLLLFVLLKYIQSAFEKACL